MDYGVDIGTRRLAVACPATGHCAELRLPTLKRGTREPIHDALRELAGWFIDTVPPDARLWVEAVIVGGSGNVQTAIRMALTAGAALAVHQGPATPVASASWKAKVVGHGHASKQDVRTWLEDHHPALAAACGASQDLVDATCLGFYGQGMAPAGELQGPT